MSTKRFIPAARWTSDVGGKQDFDGPLLSISTRYWPGWKSSDNRPSAHASLLIDYGGMDAEGNPRESTTLSEAEFSGDTELEVRAQVEDWVSKRCEGVMVLLGVTLP